VSVDIFISQTCFYIQHTCRVLKLHCISNKFVLTIQKLQTVYMYFEHY